MELTEAQLLVMSVTAAHTTEAQDEALDAVTDTLDDAGRSDTFPETPDARYDAVAAAIDEIPDYEVLADAIAAFHGKDPADGGLDNDPLTRMLHDVYSEAQMEAERELGMDPETSSNADPSFNDEAEEAGVGAWTVIEAGYGGDLSERDEEGDQRAVAPNSVTGERVEFRHRDALEDARLHCMYGNETAQERRERQEPFGSDWHDEQRDRGLY